MAGGRTICPELFDFVWAGSAPIVLSPIKNPASRAAYSNLQLARLIAIPVKTSLVAQRIAMFAITVLFMEVSCWRPVPGAQSGPFDCHAPLLC